jgi:hypothetical protein
MAVLVVCFEVFVQQWVYTLHCPSLRPFVPNSLQACRHYFFSDSCVCDVCDRSHLLPCCSAFRGVYSPTAPVAPSLRPLVPSGSIIGCQSVQVYHHHPAFAMWGRKFRVWSTLAHLSLLLCVLSFLSLLRGPTPPQYPEAHFPQSTRSPDYFLSDLQLTVFLRILLSIVPFPRRGSCLLLRPLKPLPLLPQT